MLKRLIAIVFIFCSASVAWMILGGTLVQRTGQSDVEPAREAHRAVGQRPDAIGAASERARRGR